MEIRTAATIADESAVGLLARHQAGRPLPRVLQVARLAGGMVQFHQCHQCRVVIDDVFLAVGAVLRIELAQVVIGPLRVGQIDRAFEFAMAAGRLGQHRCARECGDGHAAARAERRAIPGVVSSGGPFVAGDHAFGPRSTPLVEHRGVEIAFRIQDAMQVVGAPECFVLYLRLQAMRGEQRLARVRAIGQHPRRHRSLLRIEEVGIAQVRQVFALVAAGILPATPHVHPARGLEDGQVPVRFVGVAAAPEVTQQLRAGRGEHGVIAYRHRCRGGTRRADAHIHLVLAGLLGGRKIDAEVALARTPFGKGGQRPQFAALDRLAVAQHGVAAPAGIARVLDDGPLRSSPLQCHLVDLDQQRLSRQAYRDGGCRFRCLRRERRQVREDGQGHRQRGEYGRPGLAGMRRTGHRHGSG